MQASVDSARVDPVGMSGFCNLKIQASTASTTAVVGKAPPRRPAVLLAGRKQATARCTVASGNDAHLRHSQAGAPAPHRARSQCLWPGL